MPAILDTHIMGDVDEAGAVAVLRALANRGEAKILAMGVCARNPRSPPCLQALSESVLGHSDRVRTHAYLAFFTAASIASMSAPRALPSVPVEPYLLASLSR